MYNGFPHPLFGQIKEYFKKIPHPLSRQRVEKVPSQLFKIKEKKCQIARKSKPPTCRSKQRIYFLDEKENHFPLQTPLPNIINETQTAQGQSEIQNVGILRIFTPGCHTLYIKIFRSLSPFLQHLLPENKDKRKGQATRSNTSSDYSSHNAELLFSLE